MYDIDEIMGMLDCNNSLEVQQKGLELAKNIKSINAFVLPMHPGCNKNVWGNCARILSDRSDDELTPCICDLLEWLQDINRIGALIIIERLKKYSDVKWLSFCVKWKARTAIAVNDLVWIGHLSELLDNEKLKDELPQDILEVLQKHYHNWGYGIEMEAHDSSTDNSSYNNNEIIEKIKEVFQVYMKTEKNNQNNAWLNKLPALLDNPELSKIFTEDFLMELKKYYQNSEQQVDE